MCGRFAMDGTVYQLLDHLAAPGAAATLRGRAPNYNIAPTQQVPVLRERHGRREVALARWGMVPPGAATFGGGKPVYNARIETVDSRGLFQHPFRSNRAIVFATGYYEWEAQGAGKQPYFIRDPGRPLAMAAILRAWPDPVLADDDPDRWRLSMSIITRDAHIAPGLVHDRMPAALRAESYDAWLGGRDAGRDAGDDAGDLLGLLASDSAAIAGRLDCYPVSRSVNRVERARGVPNDGPELIEPL